MTNKTGMCSVTGCGKIGPLTRTWCHKHYRRYRKTGSLGSPENRRAPSNPSPEELLLYWGWEVTEGGCWEANGFRNADGYVIWSGHGRKTSAHRVSYENSRGVIPRGSEVRHSCDNPPCINPDHLEIGTHSDNMIDRSRRGRHPRAVASPDLVRQVREMRSSGFSRRETAQATGLSEPVVTSITTGAAWSWVEGT